MCEFICKPGEEASARAATNQTESKEECEICYNHKHNHHQPKGEWREVRGNSSNERS